MKDEHLTELFKKGAIGLILRVCGACLAFFLTIFLARELGADEYGLFVLSLTLVTILSVGVRLGLDVVVLKRVSAANEKKNIQLVRGILISALQLVVVVGIVFSVFGFIVSPAIANVIFNKSQLAQPLEMMTFFLLPISIALLLSEALRGLKQIAESTIIQSIFIPGLSLLIFMVASQWLVWNLAFVIVVYVAVTYITMFIAWRFWVKHVRRGKSIKVSASELLRSSFPLLLAASGGLILSWTDTLVLGIYESSEIVGVYAVASKTALLSSLILLAVNSIAAPKFSAFYVSGNVNAIAKLARQSTLLMIGLVLLPTSIILLWSESILQLFGSDYIRGAATLMILAIGQLVNVACGSVGYLLMMTGHEVIVRNIILFTVIINISLNVLLVQHFGIEGVAFATAASNIVLNIWMLVAVRKYLGFWTISVGINRDS